MEEREKVCDETNAKHRAAPEPGDYWNEMMAPHLLVLSRTADGRVLVITDTKDVDFGWMWDFDKARIVTLDEMTEATRYCFCYPRFHENAVGWWREHLGLPATADSRPLAASTHKSHPGDGVGNDKGNDGHTG